MSGPHNLNPQAVAARHMTGRRGVTKDLHCEDGRKQGTAPPRTSLWGERCNKTGSGYIPLKKPLTAKKAKKYQTAVWGQHAVGDCEQEENLQ